MSFVSTQFKCQTVLFDPLIGPYLVQLLQVSVDLEAMAMKRYSIFPKALRLEPTIRWFNVISRTVIGEGRSYSSAKN